MTAPNANTLWAQAIVAELAAAGTDAVCIAPGSRSTPLTMAFAAHEDITVYSILDERSAAYFALGRARMTGRPTPVVTTSGTATANLHPAVLEADTGRVPLLLLSADRPPELQDSGANQTVDQTNLFGDAVRWFSEPGLPEADGTALRSMRTTISRAVASTMEAPAGPVHLNLPFRKPLEPTEVPGDVPESFEDTDPEAARGRDGEFVTVHSGTRLPGTTALTDAAATLSASDRPLIVVGPMDPWEQSTEAITDLATATNAPVLADPLSGLRFGQYTDTVPVIGQYDAYLTESVTESWPNPDIVVRFGASPTSKSLRQYLDRTRPRQLLIDPGSEWREAQFRATDLLVGDVDATAKELADAVSGTGLNAWWQRWCGADRVAQSVFDDLPYFEGALLQTVLERAPPGSTVGVANSTPIRDFDRFGHPQPTSLTTVGNRGASGIDGLTSTALGAGSTNEDQLIVVLGDLAYYHDMNGLLNLQRCSVDATIILINNDGGGIFYQLPIAAYDPPFTEQFRTPHGLDFEPSADLYDVEYVETQSLPGFDDAFTASLESKGSQLIEAITDPQRSHQIRKEVTQEVRTRLGAGE